MQSTSSVDKRNEVKKSYNKLVQKFKTKDFSLSRDTNRFKSNGNTDVMISPMNISHQNFYDSRNNRLNTQADRSTSLDQDLKACINE
jgi:hypothetical protein